jgi:hypothetical protein
MGWAAVTLAAETEAAKRCSKGGGKYNRRARGRSTTKTKEKIKMVYQRKTRDTYEVQGNYGYGHGWECVDTAENRLDGLAALKNYRKNEPGTALRLKLVREKIEV